MSVGSSNFISHFYGTTLNETNLSRQWNCNFVRVCKAVGFSQTKDAVRVTNLYLSNQCNDAFLVKCYNEKSTKTVSIPDDNEVLEGSGDDNGKIPPENGDYGRGGGGGGGEGGDEDEKEFGPLLKFEDVMRETEKHGATLPSDLLEAAKTTGIRELILMRYLELQVLFSTHYFGIVFLWQSEVLKVSNYFYC